MFDFNKFNIPRNGQLKLDSRTITTGDIFVALPGYQCDGRDFITSALKQGASLVLAEANLANPKLGIINPNATPIVYIENLNQKISQIAGIFYNNPSQELQLVGVTGTNGKTTITNLIAQWANLLGRVSAVMGTIGNGIYGSIQEATNTTGSAVEIQATLAKFNQQNADLVAIEVSSHGLAEYRVEDLNFAAAVFSNLSRDHLDYHQTMANYALAKKRLFTELKTKVKVINADDQTGANWLTEFPDAVAVSCAYDFKPKNNEWLHATDIIYHANGIEIEFKSSFGNGRFKSKLFGKFNAENLLLAMATLLKLGYPLSELIQTGSELNGICGRMEMFTAANKPTVVVDYAHTPDALENALKALQQHCSGNIWCIFGCGGDRDVGKRPLMGQIAEQLAQQVIITNDNPRTEDPKIIIDAILQGLENPKASLIMEDRQQAIEYALTHAKNQDIILVAGKGHEDYQIIGNEKKYFSDRDIVQKNLGNM